MASKVVCIKASQKWIKLFAPWTDAAIGCRFRSFSVINFDNTAVTFIYYSSSYAADQTIWNTTCDSPPAIRQHSLIRLLRSNLFLTVDRIPNCNRNSDGRLGIWHHAGLR